MLSQSLNPNMNEDTGSLRHHLLPDTLVVKRQQGDPAAIELKVHSQSPNNTPSEGDICAPLGMRNTWHSVGMMASSQQLITRPLRKIWTKRVPIEREFEKSSKRISARHSGNR